MYVYNIVYYINGILYWQPIDCINACVVIHKHFGGQRQHRNQCPFQGHQIKKQKPKQKPKQKEKRALFVSFLKFEFLRVVTHITFIVIVQCKLVWLLSVSTLKIVWTKVECTKGTYKSFCISFSHWLIPNLFYHSIKTHRSHTYTHTHTHKSRSIYRMIFWSHL